MTEISVIFPAYDVADFIGPAMRSLALQTTGPMQVVIVDDGSTDGTGAAIEAALPTLSERGHEVVVRRQENGGLGSARNAALAHATGEIVLFLDGDDRLHPDAVARLRSALLADTSLTMVFPRCRHVDEAGDPLGIVSPRIERDLDGLDLLDDNPIHTDSGVLIRRAAIAAAGGFDANLASGIGLDAWVRASGGRTRTIRQLDAVLVDYRRRGGQITGDWRRQQVGWTAVMQKTRARGLTDDARCRAARARAGIVWATTAYKSGDHTAARTLLGQALRDEPMLALRDGHARIRLLAVLAAYLPDRLHRALARLAAGFGRTSAR